MATRGETPPGFAGRGVWARRRALRKAIDPLELAAKEREDWELIRWPWDDVFIGLRIFHTRKRALMRAIPAPSLP